MKSVCNQKLQWWKLGCVLCEIKFLLYSMNWCQVKTWLVKEIRLHKLIICHLQLIMLHMVMCIEYFLWANDSLMQTNLSLVDGQVGLLLIYVIMFQIYTRLKKNMKLGFNYKLGRWKLGCISQETKFLFSA